MSDVHTWNSWQNYRFIHEKYMENHPFVLEDHLEWEYLGDPSFPEAILLIGSIYCKRSVVIDVWKHLETRLVGQGQLQVQGVRYSYNAYILGQGNILRYDNGHTDPEQFHRHEFDLHTGKEKLPTRILTRREMPTLAQFIDEVSNLAGEM